MMEAPPRRREDKQHKVVVPEDGQKESFDDRLKKSTPLCTYLIHYAIFMIIFGVVIGVIDNVKERIREAQPKYKVEQLKATIIARQEMILTMKKLNEKAKKEIAKLINEENVHDKWESGMGPRWVEIEIGKDGSFGFAHTGGRIVWVTEGSPAEASGMKAGDTIARIDGNLASSDEITGLLKKARAAGKATFEVNYDHDWFKEYDMD